MIVEKNFFILQYNEKVSVILRFIFILFTEVVANKLLYKYGISLSLFILLLFIFTKKYFTPILGSLLFLIIYVIYFIFSQFSMIQLSFIAIILFFFSKTFNSDKTSALFFLVLQYIIFYAIDRQICLQSLFVSILIHIFIINTIKLDLIPADAKTKETVFL